MPQHIKSIVVNAAPGGETQLKITLELELNINLNTNGLDASVKATAKKVEELSEKDEVGWVIPDFGSQKVHFGKQVDDV